MGLFDYQPYQKPNHGGVAYEQGPNNFASPFAMYLNRLRQQLRFGQMQQPRMFLPNGIQTNPFVHRYDPNSIGAQLAQRQQQVQEWNQNARMLPPQVYQAQAAPGPMSGMDYPVKGNAPLIPVNPMRLPQKNYVRY